MSRIHPLNASEAPRSGAWRSVLAGAQPLFRKEVLRFWKVSFQTVAAPVLTAVMYLLLIVLLFAWRELTLGKLRLLLQLGIFVGLAIALVGMSTFILGGPADKGPSFPLVGGHGGNVTAGALPVPPAEADH